MRFFSCCLSKRDSTAEQSIGVVNTASGTQSQPGPTQTLNILQQALLGVEGSWLRRAEELLRILLVHGFVAQIYALIRYCDSAGDDWVVLLSNTERQRGNDDERVALVTRLSTLQPPQTLSGPLLIARHSKSGDANSPPPSPSAAIPLIQAGQVRGCLWLAGRTPALASAARPPPSGTAAAAGTAVPLAQPTESASPAAALLANDDALRQLSVAASLVLGGTGSDSLRWLSEAIGRLRAAPSMQALTRALCASLEGHIRDRFVLEPAVSAALVPPAAAAPLPTLPPALEQPTPAASAATAAAAPDAGAAAAATALLFRSPAASRAAPLTPSGGAAGAADFENSAQGSRITGGSPGGQRGLSATQAGDGPQAGAGAGGSAAPQKPGSYSRPSQTPDDDGAGSSHGLGSPGGPATGWTPLGRPQPPGQVLSLAAATGSVLRSTISSTEQVEPLSAIGTGLGGAVSGTRTGTGLGLGRSTARSASHTAVVALSREDLAAMATSAPQAASSVLHAEAFSFKGSLLQAVLAAHQKQHEQPPPPPPPPRTLRIPRTASAPAVLPSPPPPSARSPAHSPPPPRILSAAAATAAVAVAAPFVIEDTHLHLQIAGYPSGDVCLLMGHRTGGASAAAAASTTGGGEGPIALSALAGRAQSGTAGRQPGPESLVVLAARLPAGAALGLYLCFPRRLPGPLLEAVRASCQELLDKVLAKPVREQLMGPLAVEYDTLKNATPGSYAVLRGLAVSGDVPSAAAGAAGLSMPPPTYSGGDGGDNDSGDDDAAVARQRAQSVRRQRTTASALSSSVGEPARRAASFSSRFRSAEAGEPTPFVEGLRRRLSAALRANSATSAKFRLPAAAAAVHPTAGSSVQTAPAAIDSASAAAAAAAAGLMMRSRTGMYDDPTAGSFLPDLTQTCGLEGDLGSGPAELDRLLDTSTYGLGTAASIITVTADALSNAERAARRMDLLVGSIHTSLQASVAAGASAYSHATDLEQLQLVEVLGRGGGGVVLRGVMNGSLPVAVKLVQLAEDDAAQSDNEAGVHVRRVMLRQAMELAVQAALSHPNIVQFYGTFSNVILRSRETSCAVDSSCEVDPTTLYLQIQAPDAAQGAAPDDSSSNVTCILAEYCDRGSLLDALASGAFPPRVGCASPASATPPGSASASRNSSGPAPSAPSQYDMRAIYSTLLDVALALRHLHSMNLVHRDLKPANLLLKSSSHDPRGFTVKLADFGFVLQLTETSEDGSRFALVESPCGTLTHMAPESLQRNAQLDAAVDVYSFGILMWELVAGGVRPFANVAVARIPGVVRSGARPSFAEHVPQQYRGLAHQCWRTDPRRRPRAADLVSVIGSLLSSLKRQ